MVTTLVEKGWLKALTSVKRGQSKNLRFLALGIKENTTNQNINKLKILELKNDQLR